MIKGMITKVFVQKDDDWGVYGMEDMYGREMKAVGVIPGASVGMNVTMEGKEELTRFGKQFTITSVLSADRDEMSAVRRYLTDFVKGCGGRRPDAVIRYFGADTEKVLFSPDAQAQLTRVKGLGPVSAKKIKKSIDETKGYYPLLRLTQGSLTKNQADRILNTYKEKTLSVLKKNPYRLIVDIKGFGFRKADSIAEGMGIKKNSLVRISAGITYTIDTASENDGDCYLTEEDIRSRIGALLVKIPKPSQPGITKEMIENALPSWDRDGRERFIKMHAPSAETLETADNAFIQRQSIDGSLSKALALSIKAGDLIDEDGRISTKDMHRYECDSAARIASMLKRKPLRRVTERQVERSVKSIEAIKTAELKAKGIDEPFSVTDEQKEAVARSLSKRVSVIAGGPGRGKTTIIQIIVDAFLNSGKNDRNCIEMFAPTGRAAQRIKEQTGFEASTIHRGIYKYENGSPKIKEPRPSGKLIIVDESSMIDIYLMRGLLDYAEDCQVIFVGDVDQIASVGPGKVLKDLISCGEIPVSFLKKGHRNTGSIARNSVMINRGIRTSSYVYDSHFVYIPTDIDHIQQAVVNDYVRKSKEYPLKDILLCVAMRERGPVCVRTMNTVLQEIFTKGHKEVKIGQNTFRVGDRVMQTKNNYNFFLRRSNGETEPGVFNGEKGSVTDITFEYGDPSIHVAFDDGSYGMYTKDQAADLTLAYAITVHKCQGSESPCVMMAYTFGDFMLLKRSLFYTGETRAQKEFRFYGEEKYNEGRTYSAFDLALSRTDDKERNTMLAERIKKAVHRAGKLTA